MRQDSADSSYKRCAVKLQKQVTLTHTYIPAVAAFKAKAAYPTPAKSTDPKAKPFLLPVPRMSVGGSLATEATAMLHSFAALLRAEREAI